MNTAVRTPAVPELDLVFVDQRGTQAEGGLRCRWAAPPAVRLQSLFPLQDLERRRRELTARTDLAAYGTVAAADDVAEVLDRLGYRRFNLYGLSYGSGLALTIAARHPERVRAVAVDGVVSDRLRAPLDYASSAQDALERLFTDCARDSTCRRAVPELELEFATMPIGLRASGVAVGPVGGTAYGRHLTLICSEDLPRHRGERPRRATDDTFLGDWVLTQYERACAVWNVPATAPRAIAALDVPLLALSGARYPVTPPALAEALVERSAHALHVVFPYGGHFFDGALDHGCKFGILARFFTSASVRELDATCAARLAPAPFRFDTASTSCGRIAR